MSRKDRERKEEQAKVKEQPLKIVVAEIIQSFFTEERGNKVTSNNMDGLLGKLLRAVQLHEAKTEKEGGSC